MYDITIIDYGFGNVGSIKNMIKSIGYKAQITDNMEDILNARRLILPGVGSFDRAIKSLEKLNLIDIIREYSLTMKKPILGICLGMQLLGLKSEEGSLEGLNLVPFEVKKLPRNIEKKIPNMGFRNTVKANESILSSLRLKNPRFYFVHSYYVPFSEEYTTLSVNYIENFSAAIAYKNIYGTQFHPEKSHSFGKELLTQFIEGT